MSRGTHRAAPAHRPARRAIRALLSVVAIVAVIAGQAWVSAAWLSSAGPSGIRQVQAATLSTAAAPTATQVAGGKTVGISWTGVTLATTYEVRHYTTATGGTGTVACTSTGTSCVDPTARTGSAHYYSVVARLGTNWMSESPRTAYTSDDATTVAISALGSDTGTSATDFITKTGSNTLTGTSEASAAISITRGGTQIATATANGSGAWTSSTFTLNEGLQDLVASATDAFGNTATATKSNIRLDTVAPTATQSAPCTTVGNAAPSGNWCKQTTQTMTATYADTGGSGLLSGSTKYSLYGAAAVDYTTPVTLNQVNGGVVQLTASDVAGNTTSTSVTYYIDGTAPIVTITRPTAGPSLSLAILGPLLDSTCGGKAACGTATDATSGVPATSSVGWKLLKNGGILADTCYTATGSTSCAGYGFQAAAGTLPNWTSSNSPPYAILSSYVLTIQVTDAAGNIGTASINFSTVL